MKHTTLPYYRALFLSDIHLGYKDCKAEYLLDLLQRIKCDTLYLVGDIVDLWSLKRKVFWPAHHHQLLSRLLSLPNEGTRVVYIPGNHDEAMREFLHLEVNQIEIYREIQHVTERQQKFLVLHGDAFDRLVSCAPLLGWIGDKMYDFLLFINRWFNRIRRLLGKPYWSLSSFIKSNVNGAQKYIRRFRSAATQFAAQKGFDGVICGHIHQAEICQLEQGVYANCGDWIESCTFLVENHCGNIELLHWSDQQLQISTLAFDELSRKKAA